MRVRSPKSAVQRPKSCLMPSVESLAGLSGARPGLVKRMECVELAPAFELPNPPDSGSKLRALHTLCAVRLRLNCAANRGPRPTTNHQSPTTAFTLVEILIAIGIFGLVMTAIYSSWTAILRADKVGKDVAAAVQRSRIAARTIEDGLLCIESFAANQKYYGFASENGSEAYLSFVARLPKSFPRSGKFGDLDVRRITFSIESSAESARQLVLRQCPLLGDFDADEKDHPLVLAKYVSEFKVEFWDSRQGDWTDEWKETKTNSLPPLVKISLDRKSVV